MGPLAFSSNAEPTYSLRFVSTRPHPLPFFPSLGTYRFDIVLGKLSGHSYPARPWYNGQKASLQLRRQSRNQLHSLVHLLGASDTPSRSTASKPNVFSFDSTGGGPGGGGGERGYGDRDDPGDRKSNFDFTYRLPFLRRVVTLYADAYSDDDPSPIDAPRRAVLEPRNLFCSFTLSATHGFTGRGCKFRRTCRRFGGGHFFINNQYIDGNSNKGFLLGNAVGRDARAIEGRTGLLVFCPHPGRGRLSSEQRWHKVPSRWRHDHRRLCERLLTPSIATGRRSFSLSTSDS